LTPVRRETEIHPGVAEVEFSSRVLGALKAFCVITPTAAPRDGDGWPVLFFLHGRGRTHRTLVDLEAMRRAFLDAPFCTVFPDGGDGWYIDSPVESGARYETYLAEVIAMAERVRRVSQARDGRAIAGWSMGGYGAMRFAIRHPDEFGIVAPIIGLLDFPRSADLPAGQNYNVPVARFGADPSVWSEFNPLHRTEALRGRAILIITAADAFDRTMNEHFHARLRALNIPHEYLVLPGAHTFPVVQAAVPHVISFVARHLAAAESLSSSNLHRP
jgi:S-formylglutathione hydrolase FrmB